MKIEYDSHYDEKYWTGRKQYRTADGKEHVYQNPALYWDGFDLVVNAVAPFIPGKTLLDVGCGGGDLARRFMSRGYDAYGIDISDYAVNNTVLKGRVAKADLTTCPTKLITPDGVALPNSYDVLIATDLLEHIYEDDLNNAFSWMMDKSNRWLFFCVAVSHEREFIHKRGRPVPLEFESMAVSGHVNVRSWKYWARYFRHRGLRICWDAMYVFQLMREQDKAWKATGGWDMGSTWLLEKV